MRHLITIGTFCLAFPMFGVDAHGGGLDASGCHNDRKRGGYHCHRGSIAPVPSRSSSHSIPNLVLPTPLPLFSVSEPPTEDLKVTIQPDKSAYWKDDRWSVFSYPEEGSCEIGITPKDGEYLTVQYRPKLSAVTLLVTNQAATSKNDGEVVVLDILLLNDQDFTGSWKDVSFVVKVLPDGRRAIVSSILTKNFLSMFASEKFVAVVTKTGTMVGGVNLSGSAGAIKQLRACAYSAAGLNPADPFLDGL